MTLDEYKLLRKINSPRDLKQLSAEELRTYCDELRSYIIDECSVNPVILYGEVIIFQTDTSMTVQR